MARRGDKVVGVVRGADQARAIEELEGTGVVIDVESAAVEELAQALA
ncbi:hypothetical protein ACFVY1_29470 [Streptomyces sp. NPDC058293]